VRIGRFDFILIAVHMKSARGRAERETRTRQAKAIADFISGATTGSEKDVLLVGDYNMIPGQDDINFQTLSPGTGTNEFLRFISTERLRGQISHFSNCSPIRGNLLDGYAIASTFTREYREASLRLIPFTDPIFRQPSGTQFNCATYTGLVSDHLPLVARFRANSDDD
jgi:endonuclease/exonuclease/phosphatase (EEP) superfamily protein YafD